MPLNSLVGRQKQADLYKFKASLVYKVSAKTARAVLLYREILSHKTNTSPTPSIPDANGRDGPVVIRAGALSLTPSSCSPQESRPCTSPGQYSRAHPAGAGMGE